RTERNFLTEDFNWPGRKIRSRSKPALLVEFLVIGQKRFRNNSQNSPGMKNRRTVEESIIHCQRQPDDCQAGENRASLFDDLFQSGHGASLQGGLMKQIGACVSSQRQFGEDDDRYLYRSRPPEQLKNAVGVGMTVRHLQ